MAAAECEPQPLQAYASLDKAGAAALLDAVDDAIDALEADPGAAAVRRRSFGDGLWGIPGPGSDGRLADHLGMRSGRGPRHRHPIPRRRSVRLIRTADLP